MFCWCSRGGLPPPPEHSPPFPPPAAPADFPRLAAAPRTRCRASAGLRRAEAFAQSYTGPYPHGSDDGTYERVLRYTTGEERRIRYPLPPAERVASEDLTDGCWGDTCWVPREQWSNWGGSGGAGSGGAAIAPSPTLAARGAAAPGTFLPQQPPPAQVRTGIHAAAWAVRCKVCWQPSRGPLEASPAAMHCCAPTAPVQSVTPPTLASPPPPSACSLSATSCLPPPWSSCATSTPQSTSRHKRSSGSECAGVTRCALGGREGVQLAVLTVGMEPAGAALQRCPLPLCRPISLLDCIPHFLSLALRPLALQVLEGCPWLLPKPLYLLAAPQPPAAAASRARSGGAGSQQRPDRQQECEGSGRSEAALSA